MNSVNDTILFNFDNSVFDTNVNSCGSRPFCGSRPLYSTL